MDDLSAYTRDDGSPEDVQAAWEVTEAFGEAFRLRLNAPWQWCVPLSATGSAESRDLRGQLSCLRTVKSYPPMPACCYEWVVRLTRKNNTVLPLHWSLWAGAPFACPGTRVWRRDGLPKLERFPTGRV